MTTQHDGTASPAGHTPAGARPAAPGSPGSVRDRETRWALYAATYRRKRGMYGIPTTDRTPGVLLTAYGRTVVLANPRKPYGRSTHARATLTHLVREVLLAYRDGHLTGALASWWCGSHTAHFHLDDEAPGPLCLICQANAVREVTGSAARDVNALHLMQCGDRPGSPT